MVLAQRVGKKRSLVTLPLMGAMGLVGQAILYIALVAALLTLVELDDQASPTDDQLGVIGLSFLGVLFGGGMALANYIYVRVWIRLAHHEVHKQFELSDQGLSSGLAAYILSFFVPVFLYVYEGIFASQVDLVRQRMRLPRGISPTTFVILTVIGGVPSILLAIVLRASPEDIPTAVLIGLLVLYAVFLLVDAVLSIIAYTWMQRTLNAMWDTFDARVAQLSAARSAGLPPGPTPGAWPARPPGPTGGA